MNASTRTARHTLRARQAQTRAAARARRLVATGTPQTARVHLVAAGLADTDAKRFAGAFSRGVLATATARTTVKLTGRTTKRVAVKLYDLLTFRTRLAMYRPADKTAAARFAAVAA